MSHKSFRDIEVNDLLHEKGNHKLLFVDSKAPLVTTLQAIVQNKIHSVPIFDENSHKFYAFVDLLDFVVHIGKEYLENQIIECNVWRLLEIEKRFTIGQIASL
jgi:hypothetical protein